ncbi:MAG: heterodisulfide reductase-related iron-sulfur binding cluster, partial [Acidimicrobiales bacterium]
MTRVTLGITCMIDGFAPEVGEAVVQCLRDAGCDVSVPLNQTCCGQPAWNSGFVEDAAKVAATTMDALEADGGDVVVVPAGSCATMMRKFWAELFEVVGDNDRAARAA